MITKKQAVKAAETVKAFCKTVESCDDCPFLYEKHRDTSTMIVHISWCSLRHISPQDWPLDMAEGAGDKREIKAIVRGR